MVQKKQSDFHTGKSSWEMETKSVVNQFSCKY